MANHFTITSTETDFTICAQASPLLTPGKHALALPTQPLAHAIAAEWQACQKYQISNMPLTTLAYTAIDRINGQEPAIVEALMTYVDTDALAYRSSASEPLFERQRQQWDPLLAWMNTRFDVHWQTTQGIMPLEQSQALHQAVRRYLASLSVMQLAAACVLASAYSSLALAIAVTEQQCDADAAFTLSRLEEDWQTEQWGEDAEAQARVARLQSEVLAAGAFLNLLDAQANPH